MTDQLERDLTALFARKAGETEVPPIPAELLAGGPVGARPFRRRTIALGLVAAAVVAAVAVPVGLALRDKDNKPSPAPQPDGPHGLELPYLLDGALHVDGLTLATTGNTLVVAGDGVLVGTADERSGRATWERFDGDSLEAMPWLDGSYAPAISYDGRLVAVPFGSGNATSLRVWDADGRVVDTIALDEPPEPEDPWVWGFDSAGRLYWQDGGGQRVRTTSGAVVELDTAGRLFVGIAPAGILLTNGDNDPVDVLTVSDDGSTSAVGEVAVSANATWRDDRTVAFTAIGDAALMVGNLAAGTSSEVPWTRSQYQLIGWSGDDIAVLVAGRGNIARVVGVDPVTGRERLILEFAVDDPAVFPSLGGTGAL